MFNHDVFEIADPKKYDLVYIDPPYFSKKRGFTDYYLYYHFLEGLCIYLEQGTDEWEALIDYKRKPRPLKHNSSLENKISIWTNRNEISNGFDRIFKKFKKSTLVISCNSEGIPSEKQMFKLLKKYKKNVSVERKKNHYALRPSDVEELLFIAT